MNINISRLTNTDLTTLAGVLGVLLVIFVLLLISQRKYLTFLRKKPQFRADAERYEQMAAEARQNHADTREVLKQADQYLEYLKASRPEESAEGVASDSGDEGEL